MKLLRHRRSGTSPRRTHPLGRKRLRSTASSSASCRPSSRRHAGCVTSARLVGAGRTAARPRRFDLAPRRDLHDRRPRGRGDHRRHRRDAGRRHARATHATRGCRRPRAALPRRGGCRRAARCPGGITAQAPEIGTYASAAADKAEGWLSDAGVDESGSSSAKSSVEQATPEIISTLTRGIVEGIAGVTSLAFGLSFAALSLFFLLKDGPSMRAWVDRHLGVPPQVAQTITGGVIRSLRG